MNDRGMLFEGAVNSTTSLEILVRLLGLNPTRTLVANSEISTLQVRQVSENSVCQYDGLRENAFATSVNFDAVCGASV